MKITVKQLKQLIREQVEEAQAKIGFSQTAEQDDADEAAAMPIAKKLLPILGDEKIVNDIVSNGKKSGFLKFVIGNKRWYDPEMNAGQGAFDDGLISAASKLGKIQNGPLKGKDFGYILKAIESNELGNEMPGMLTKGVGAVKSFFGMKEVQQMVKEEVASQLRNRR